MLFARDIPVTKIQKIKSKRAEKIYLGEKDNSDITCHCVI